MDLSVVLTSSFGPSSSNFVPSGATAMKPGDTISHRLVWRTFFGSDLRQTSVKLFSAMAVALTAMTCSATEKWVRLDSSEILGGYIVYVDQTNLFRLQPTVKMRHLINFNTVNSIEGKSFLSLKGNEEYDCQCGCHRQITFSLYSRKMGTGEVVFTNNLPGKWLPVLPGSTGLNLWKFACGNKLL